MIDTKEIRKALAIHGVDVLNVDEVLDVLNHLEAAYKEIESWKGLARQFGNKADELRTHLSFAKDELNRSRAKIAEMEQQEPVAWPHETRRDSDVVTDAVKHVVEHDDFGALPDDVVEQAVNRFLSWKLPKDFHPDGGMVFIPTKGRGYDNQPVQRFVGCRNAQEREPAMQDALMKFDPATGEERPYPSHATQWRNWHGSAAWLFDPWTGRRRNAHDVGSDVRGLLIAPAGTLGMDMGGGCAEAKL